MAPAIVLLLLLMLSRTISYSEVNYYRIQHQCERTFCFQLWKPDGFVDVALVTNGQIQSDASKVEETKCSVLTDPTDQEHVCKRKPSEFIKTDPSRNVTLQCALLSSWTVSRCFARRSFLKLSWVDENESPVKDGPEFRVTRNSDCDVTLTVSFQSPKNASFRCRARVNAQRSTSPKIGVIFPPPRGGRRVIPEPEGDSGGEADSNAVVGPTVGALSAVLLVAAAIFVLNKRRRHRQTSSESPTSTANCAVLDSDELVYADVVFAAASERARASADEDTVYASVRWT